MPETVGFGSWKAVEVGRTENLGSVVEVAHSWRLRPLGFWESLGRRSRGEWWEYF